MTRYRASGESATALGGALRMIGASSFLLTRSITSTRYPLKFAAYSLPRASSTAMSATDPWIGTTVPNVAAAAHVAQTAPATIQIESLENIRYKMTSGFVRTETGPRPQPLLLPVPVPFEEAEVCFTVRLPERRVPLVVGVLFAAQHDDPQKQDRQHGANDANSGSVHRESPFLTRVNSALLVPTFREPVLLVF